MRVLPMGIYHMYLNVGALKTGVYYLNHAINTYPKITLVASSLLSGMALGAVPASKRLIPSLLHRAPVAVLIGTALTQLFYRLFSSSLAHNAQLAKTKVQEVLGKKDQEINEAINSYDIDETSNKICFGNNTKEAIRKLGEFLKHNQHLNSRALVVVLKKFAYREEGEGFADNFFSQFWEELKKIGVIVDSKLSPETLCDVWQNFLENGSYSLMKELLDKKLVPDLGQAPDELIQKLSCLLARLDDELYEREGRSVTTGKALIFIQNLPSLFTTCTNKKHLLQKIECIEDVNKKELMTSLIHLFYLDKGNVQETLTIDKKSKILRLPNVIRCIVVFSSLPTLYKTLLDGWIAVRKKEIGGDQGYPVFTKLELYTFWNNFFDMMISQEHQADCVKLFGQLMMYDELIPGEWTDDVPANLGLEAKFFNYLESLQNLNIVQLDIATDFIDKYCTKQNKKFDVLLEEAKNRANKTAIDDDEL